MNLMGKPYVFDILALAEQLGNGQHSGLACPACEHPTDRALSLFVDGPIVKAICHRASCQFRYTAHIPGQESMSIKPSRAHPYKGELSVLTATDLVWFSGRFNAHPYALSDIRKSDGRYFLPIRGPEGIRRGWVSRRPWADSPLYEVDDMSTKSLTYMDNEEPVQSWSDPEISDTIVLLEDQISADRVAWDTGLTAVAILGTGVNEEKVAELQRHTQHILIALDADATGQAFSIARKWGQAFDSCRVVILHNDIKDTDVETVKKIFSPYAPT